MARALTLIPKAPLVLSFKDNSTVFKKGGELNAAEITENERAEVEAIDKYSSLEVFVGKHRSLE